MKKEHIFLVLIPLLAILISSCEIKDDTSTSPGEIDSTYTVTLTGDVVEASTGNPISGATIKIIDGLTVKGAVTDDNGKFSSILDVSDDIDLIIVAFKQGYVADTTTTFAIKNATTEVPIFELEKDVNSSGGTGTSGGAASINLYSQSASFIGVKESGAIESAEIVFEVRDSSGVLIDIDHAVDLNFSFGATPGGGEYLYPAGVRTNALGKASVTLNTGTIAGVVQVIAQADIDGRTIRSKPILISIHGGFPTDDLFYVACEKLNYPYLGIIGETIDFTAYLGDKYNNPVRPGTAVYFTANYGIIGGSNLTGDAGTATVQLLTEPWPNDPVYGPGFFMVTSSTADENYNTISTNTVRLLSGPPILSVSPTSFNLDNGGSQSFTYTIMDVNGNPMSEGQTIAVTIESENIDIAGATEIKFPDTQSRSMTSFSFTVFDTKPDTVLVENVKIEISTTGPNTDSKIALFGTGR
jgi:hypothetical protein